MRCSIIFGSKNLFESLGFAEERRDNESTLRAPGTDLHTPQGSLNRARLLRAWVELQAFLTDYIKINSKAISSALEAVLTSNAESNLDSSREPKLWAKLDSSREAYQTGIGAHPNQSWSSTLFNCT